MQKTAARSAALTCDIQIPAPVAPVRLEVAPDLAASLIDEFGAQVVSQGPATCWTIRGDTDVRAEQSVSRILHSEPHELVRIDPHPGSHQWLSSRGRVVRAYRDGYVLASRGESDVVAAGRTALYSLLRTELTSVIRWLLGEAGLLVLHAGLIARNGYDAGVLFVGTKGAGKTTSCLLAHRLGYSLLTDELCYWDWSHPPRVGGVYRRPALGEEVLGALGMGGSSIWRPLRGDDITTKYLINLPAPLMTRPIPVVAVIVPRFGHIADCEVGTLSEGEAYGHLAEASMAPEGGATAASRAFARIQGSIERIRWSFTLNTERNLRSLDALLGRLLRS